MIRHRTRLLPLGATLALAAALAGCQPATQQLEGIPNEISVIAGEHSRVSSPGAGQWTFAVTVERERAQQQAIDQLVAAGFEIAGERAAAGSRTVSLVNEAAALNVTLKLTGRGEQRTVIYNIAQR